MPDCPSLLAAAPPPQAAEADADPSGLAPATEPTVYLLMVREFRRPGAPHVFKVGRSGNFDHRLKSYPRHTAVLGRMPVNDDVHVEKLLITAFQAAFRPRTDYGRESFEVPRSSIDEDVSFQAACAAAVTLFSATAAPHVHVSRWRQ